MCVTRPARDAAGERASEMESYGVCVSAREMQGRAAPVREAGSQEVLMFHVCLARAAGSRAG